MKHCSLRSLMNTYNFPPEVGSCGPISPFRIYALVKFYINQRCNNFSYLHYERISIPTFTNIRPDAESSSSDLFMFSESTRTYINAQTNHGFGCLISTDSGLIDLRVLLWAAIELHLLYRNTSQRDIYLGSKTPHQEDWQICPNRSDRYSSATLGQRRKQGISCVVNRI